MLKLGRKKGIKKFKGCEEDCLNCPYPDCYKPAQDMKPLSDITNIARCDRVGNGESQGKMYTLELGGYGKTKPNASRKYYF
jgi:hypothetical protein